MKGLIFMMRCPECGTIFDGYTYSCPNCLNPDVEPYSENDDPHELFVSQLDYNIRNTNIDTDHPTCPDCGGTMNFHGHDDSGDWNCQEKCSHKIPKILDRPESGSVMSKLL